MENKKGRPRGLAQAAYTQKRRSELAPQRLIAEDLSTISPHEQELEVRQVRRWEKEDLGDPTRGEVARAFAWANGVYGQTPLHQQGRPEFEVHLSFSGGVAYYSDITFEGTTPWKHLVLDPRRIQYTDNEEVWKEWGETHEEG